MAENTTETTLTDVVAQEQKDVAVETFKDSEEKKMSFVGKILDKLSKTSKTPDESSVETNENIETEETTEENTTETVDEKETDDVEKESVESTDEKETDSEQTVKISDIDKRLVMAAKRRGWSDDKIINYFKTDKTVLEDIANLSEFQESEKKDSEDEVETVSTEVKKIEGISFTKEQVESLRKEYGDVLVDTVIMPIVEANKKQAELLNEIQVKESERNQRAKRREEEEFDHTFTQTLDAASKTYSQLGVWENVPLLPNGKVDTNSEMFRLRAELWDRAKFAKAVLGMSNDDAVKDALIYAKGKLTEKAVEKKLVQDLNKSKKRILNRPKQRKTEKTFTSPKEKIIHTMTEAYKEAGIE